MCSTSIWDITTEKDVKKLMCKKKIDVHGESLCKATHQDKFIDQKKTTNFDAHKSG